MAKAIVAAFLVFTLASLSRAADDKAPAPKAAAKPKAAPPLPANPQISYAGFLKAAKEVEAYRAKRRVSEQEFLRMSREKGTVVLDTRSARAFEHGHVKGAVHLNFSDFTKKRLAEAIPSKQTRVLIYCNNNFFNEDRIFPKKAASMALNIPTFITLHEYGYRNVYELQPVIDYNKTILPMATGAPERPPLRTHAKARVAALDGRGQPRSPTETPGAR